MTTPPEPPKHPLPPHHRISTTVTTWEVEESRRRNHIPADWLWAPCAARCGDIVWYPPGAVDAAKATGTPVMLTCSAACSMRLMLDKGIIGS